MIRIHMAGLKETRYFVQTLATRIEHPDQKLMQRLGDTLLDDTDQRFMTRGYGTWAPNKPSINKRKKGSTVLIDTGAMFASTQVSISNSKTSLTVPYGGAEHNPDVPRYHQQGTSRMPQRKILEVTPQLLRALKETVVLWVRDMIKASRKSV
ncbi:MAG: hypothetical protein A9183_03055 [Dehalococcoides mccartyi]|uniref:phage virion morphogenesis protein n=1 Tax=Dehalococcoides mccartyi TaxID=61435 RepID=UPI000805C354|nr:phage virion morphogenesis protein [Dehalococcoides mccartyi]OBW61097.1 MAG: hypothetical protein A9183_03055 [Dehalococcoides mccartyi]